MHAQPRARALHSEEKEGRLCKLDVQTTQSSFPDLTEHQQLVKFYIRNSLDHPINPKEKDKNAKTWGSTIQRPVSSLYSKLHSLQDPTTYWELPNSSLVSLDVCTVYIYIIHIYISIYTTRELKKQPKMKVRQWHTFGRKKKKKAWRLFKRKTISKNYY